MFSSLKTKAFSLLSSSLFELQLAAGACCWNVVELGGAASELECESCRFMCAAEHRHIGTDLHHFWAGGKAAGCRRKTLGRPLRLCLRVFIKVAVECYLLSVLSSFP